MEINNTRYSIIIPHYNIPDLLGRCLRSIPEREDVQVIVVDDNSPGHECYLENIPELSRNNVEFYVTEDGLGAGHARNIGLSHAKGEWVIFSDSDDFFVDDFNKILDEYINNLNDIVFFNIMSCDCYNTSHVMNINRDFLFNCYDKTENDIGFRICYTEPWGKIFRRQFLTENNIQFQETKANNDLYFSVKSGVLAKQICIVNRPLYWYVFREGSLGHQKGLESFEKIRDRVLAWNRTQIFLNECGIKTNFYLPVMPCVMLVRTNQKMLIKILAFMKDSNIDYLRVIRDIVRHYLKKIITGKGLLGVERIVDIS